MNELHSSTFALQLFLSAGLGAFLGIRYELAKSKYKNKKSPIGIRSLVLLSVLGFFGGKFLDPTFIIPKSGMIIASFIFLTILGLIIVAYAQSAFKQKLIGITEELSSVLTVVVGFLVANQTYTLAILLTICLGLTREFREEIHLFVSTLTKKELRGAMGLFVFSGAILPFLPTEAIDPWGIFIPFKIWLLVIFIAGIQFTGYFLSKYFSNKKGILLSSFLGAMVSSTAVSVSLGQEAKRSPEKNNILASGVFLAFATMFARVVAEILVVGGTKETPIEFLVPSLVMGILSGFFCWYYYKKSTKTQTKAKKKSFNLESPFHLLPAIKFAGLFALMIFLIHFADQFFGEKGVIITAGLSGLFDVDAVVLSGMESFTNQDLLKNTVLSIIITATIVNTLVKVIYAGVVGTKKFFLTLLIPAIIICLAGGSLFLIL